MWEAYIALGTNLGDRDFFMREALRRLKGNPQLVIGRISPMYETAPIGFTDQPAFLNRVVSVRTDLGPLPLLRLLLAIEQEMGRVRDIRWGPRNIDLDLLVYGEESMETPELSLPHPRMGERAFVLIPLKDVWSPEECFPWESQLQAFSWEKEGISRWTGGDSNSGLS